MSVNGIGVTQAELDRRARAKLSEAGVRFFSAQNLLDWENEGQDVIAADAPFTVVSSWHSQTFPNQPSYLLPPECMTPMGTMLRDATDRIVRLTYVEADLDDDQGGYSLGSGRPTTVSYRVTNEGTALDLWPAPSGVMDFYVEGYKRPTQLSAVTDRTDIPPYLVQTLVKYVVWQAKIKDEETAQADRMQADFQADLARLAERRLQSEADQYNLVRFRRAMASSAWPMRGES